MRVGNAAKGHLKRRQRGVKKGGEDGGRRRERVREELQLCGQI